MAGSLQYLKGGFLWTTNWRYLLCSVRSWLWLLQPAGAARVLKFPQGNERMQKISSSIHHGAMAYLRRQYRILICFFAGMFVILFAMAAFGYLTWFVPFAFTPGDSFPVFPALWECRSLPEPMPGRQLPASRG